MSASFTFNSITSTSKNIIVHSIDKPMLPQIITTSKQFGNRSYIGQRSFAPRNIDIEVSYLGSSVGDLYSKLTDVGNWLITKDEKKLILSYEPTYYYKAVLTESTDVEKLIAYGKTTLHFVAYDTAIYLVSNDSKVWNPDTYL